MVCPNPTQSDKSSFVQQSKVLTNCQTAAINYKHKYTAYFGNNPKNVLSFFYSNSFSLLKRQRKTLLLHHHRSHTAWAHQTNVFPLLKATATAADAVKGKLEGRAHDYNVYVWESSKGENILGIFVTHRQLPGLKHGFR